MTLNKDKLHGLIQSAFAEDIGDGDHSTLSCIPAGLKGRAVLKIKHSGVLAGMEVARAIFNAKEADVLFTPFKEDGALMENGEEAFTVEASVHTILQCERIVLNIMQRMCGIATLTRKYTDLLQGFKTKILDTRKTTPNFRLLEKEAVRIGGGINHRFGLYDMIMLKDNHIDYCGGIEKAIEKAFSYVKEKDLHIKIEVEARNTDDVRKATATGKVDRIMFDNFTPEEVVEAMKITAGRVETEASGGINLGNIHLYAQTGVDFISVGALIHQATSVDLSLKAIMV